MFVHCHIKFLGMTYFGNFTKTGWCKLWMFEHGWMFEGSYRWALRSVQVLQLECWLHSCVKEWIEILSSCVSLLRYILSIFPRIPAKFFEVTLCKMHIRYRSAKLQNSTYYFACQSFNGIAFVFVSTFYYFLKLRLCSY